MERKVRKKLVKEGLDLLEPLDVLSLGTENDPCFGKHHDLKAPECQRCGDSEFCSIVLAQNLHLKRKEIESKTPFMDLEEADTIKKMEKVRKEIKRFHNKGYSLLKTTVRIKRLYPDLNKEFIKEYYKFLK